MSIASALAMIEQALIEHEAGETAKAAGEKDGALKRQVVEREVVPGGKFLVRIPKPACI